MNVQVYEDQTTNYTNSNLAGVIYDTDYLCQGITGTSSCALEYYARKSLDMCKDLFCVSPDDSSQCEAAGLIPAIGKFCFDFLSHFKRYCFCILCF